MAVPVVSPRIGGRGYFVGERGLATRKESFTTDEIVGVHCNNICMENSFHSTQSRIDMLMYGIFFFWSICRFLHILKGYISLKAKQIQYYVNYNEYRS